MTAGKGRAEIGMVQNYNQKEKRGRRDDSPDIFFHVNSCGFRMRIPIHACRQASKPKNSTTRAINERRLS